MSDWPVVLENDNGIRPAGSPTHCFYCNQPVGSDHGRECVMVEKRVRYDVLVAGKVRGAFERNDPYFWTPDDCNWHKNDSSWCHNNAVDAIQWMDSKEGESIMAAQEECCCGLLEFRFVSVIDEGPLRSRG